MPDVFDELDAPQTDVFDEIAPEKPSSSPLKTVSKLMPGFIGQHPMEPFVNIPRITASDLSPTAAESLITPLGARLARSFTGDSDSPQKIAAGLERGAAGVIEGVENPLGAVLMTARLPNLLARGVSGAFAAHMAHSTPQIARDLGTAVGEKNLEKSIESGIGLAANAAFAGAAGAHALSPKVTPSLAELEKVVDETIPKAEVEALKPQESAHDIFDEVAAAPVAEQKPVSVEQKVEPVVAGPVRPISVGPGAASPGDVPLEPSLAGVSGGKVVAEPTQIPTIGDTISGLMGDAKSYAGSTILGLAGHSMPRTTAAAREVGEAGVRYASSRIASQPLANVFSSRVLEGSGVDPFKFGVALAEDNLRSISQAARARETAAIAEGKPEEAAKAKAEAERVKSLIGAERSPFKTEDQYQDFLAEPAVKDAIKRHIEQWDEQVGPMYREAMRLDPSVELPPRGQQTGARINLKAKLADEEGTINKPVGGSGRSLTNTFRRKSPFGVRARGTGETYEGDYGSIIANTFERQLEIANKNRFDKELVNTGLAVIDKPGQRIQIGGKSTVAFPLSRRTLIIPEKGSIPMGENIYVRSDLAGEYRRAANVDASSKIPIVTPIMNLLNKSALAGLTDFTVHLSNQMTALLDRPVSGGLLKDSLLSATGRLDMPVTLIKYISRWFKDNPAQIAELAEIGALREQRKGSKFSPGKILEKSDEIVRSMLDDTFKQLAKDGLVENTETNRREFVNQIGQYNKRLQGPFKKYLRETGAGPFVTAGTAFNALGVRMATLSPGAKAASMPAALVLRANALSKWVGFAVLLGALNYLLTKDKGGGVMGRPGVPIGKLDTGKSDANGRPYLIPLSDILGVGRGLRVTGVGGVINAKRFGLSNSDAVDSAVRDIVNSAVGPAAGPPVRFGFTAAAGKAPAIGVKDTARPKAPGESQALINLKAAAIEANPIASTIHDYLEKKPMAEVIANQIPRLTVTPGRPAEMMEDYPRIVARAQAAPFISYVIGEARRMDPERRLEYLEQMLEKLEDPEDKQHAIQEFKRRKVL